MLIDKIRELSYMSGSMSTIRSDLERIFLDASTEEFLDLIFNVEAEDARRFIDSFLDQYDERRGQVLRQIAEKVPQEHKDFFIHAFSRRIPEDDIE